MPEAITAWIIVRGLKPNKPTATVRDLESLAILIEEIVSLALRKTTDEVIEVEAVIVDHTPVGL